MNKQLKSAVSRFDEIKKNDYLISPISQLDAEIFIELTQIISKFGGDNIVQILKEYKFKKDEEIRDDLLQWNIDNPNFKKDENIKSQEPQKKIWPFLRIQDRVIRAWDIGAWNEEEEIDENGNFKFYIILNPLPEGYDLKKVPKYSNERITFDSFENRKIVLDNLEAYFSHNGIDLLNFNESNEEK